MNILITGGCGFIGSNLAVRFAAEGHQVTCFDNLSRKGSERILPRVREHGCAFVQGDIRNPADLRKVPGTQELMIECSAEPSVLAGMRGGDAWFVLDNNLIGSLHCFEYARERGMGTIFLSTSRVYPYDSINARRFREEPSRFSLDEEGQGISAHGIAEDYPLAGARSLYGATKLASEVIAHEYSRQFNLPAVVNRLGVVAGPWQLGKVDQGIFTYWLAGHYFKRPLRYIGFGGHGKQVRDLLHIDDLHDLVRSQIEQLKYLRGDVFNAGGGLSSNLSLAETTALCREITGNTVPVAAAGEDRPADLRWYVTDHRHASHTFAWQPRRAARVILEDTFRWIRENETLLKDVL